MYNEPLIIVKYSLTGWCGTPTRTQGVLNHSEGVHFTVMTISLIMAHWTLFFAYYTAIWFKKSMIWNKILILNYFTDRKIILLRQLMTWSILLRNNVIDQSEWSIYISNNYVLNSRWDPKDWDYTKKGNVQYIECWINQECKFVTIIMLTSL